MALFTANQFLIMQQQLQKNKHNEILLFFPVTFKKTGNLIMLIGAGLTLFARIISLSPQSNLIYTIALALLFIALSCISWAKENKDDELLALIKLKATRVSFIISFLIMIGFPVAGNLVLHLNSTGIILMMLLIYQLAFRFQRN